MDDKIIEDLKDSYGLACHQITSITGGWLNQKWRVATDTCEVLVKQFSTKRYSRAKLKKVESALQRQIVLEKSGVPCPSIWQCNGQVIRLLDDDIAYMVMDFRSGKTENPNTITSKQMRSLGSACGAMHSAFSKLPVLSVDGYPIDDGKVIDSLWTNFHARLRECSPNYPSEYRNAVLAQEPILKRLTAGFFEKYPKGIAHEDFAADNILFDAEGVSAIVDFDRNHYSYVWHDIGRAMLSFALKGNAMDIEKIRAFLEGYSQHAVLTLPNIADALRLSWCIEIPWWIQPDYFKNNSEKVLRFKDEVLWLTEHWFEIDSILFS